MNFLLASISRRLIAVTLACALAPAFANMGTEDAGSAGDPSVVEGKQAIEAKDFKKAIIALNKALGSDANNADVHNYLGYAYRNNGDFDNAFKHYAKALELSPGHKAAHEYIGEAYLAKGNVAKAEEHLNVLRGLCTTGCSEMSLLKEKIDAFKKKKS
jgi:Flp pilus assembly protein TadD